MKDIAHTEKHLIELEHTTINVWHDRDGNPATLIVRPLNTPPYLEGEEDKFCEILLPELPLIQYALDKLAGNPREQPTEKQT